MKNFNWEILIAHNHWVTLSFYGKKVKVCARCLGVTIGFFIFLMVTSIADARMNEARMKNTALFPKFEKTFFAESIPKRGCRTIIRRPVADKGIASVSHKKTAIASIPIIICPFLVKPSGVGRRADEITNRRAMDT